MSRLRKLGVSAAGLCLLPVLMWALWGFIPPPLLVNQTNGSYAVTDRSGKLLRLSLTSDEKYRLWTPLDQLPQSLQQATLHYEDRWFYQHPGVNPYALIRAGWRSFVARDRWMGASTLTMQLARQRWRLKTDTLPGKLKQIGYALWLERHFSKAALLEAYLNLAPYGANIEGAGAAAWVYFHKPAAELTVDEARALALIPQNPRQRAPFTEAGKLALREAWKNTYSDDARFESLWFRPRQTLPFQGPHFAERVHELYSENNALPSTLDPTVQALTEDLIRNFIRQHQAQGIVNATAMVVHAPSMEVLGYVGSADYFERRIQGFVNGLKALRSPGSTLKPFIYGLAMDQGLITPDTLLKDVPLKVGEYQPENFERNFYGPLSATEALVRSRNIPAVMLLARLQQPSLFQFLQQAGLRLARDESRYGLTLAIGGVELSMEQLLTLYGLLANGGEYRPLRWLRSEKLDRPPYLPPLPQGEEWGEGDSKSRTQVSPLIPTFSRGEKELAHSENRRLLSAQATFLVRQMLEANPRPQRSFGVRSFGNDAPVAWKTGTSSGLKDAWAVGLRGDLLAGVWLGNFDGAPNRQLVGRDLAGPLLFGILEAIGLERPAATPPASPPPGLKRVEICPLSGALRSPWCPHGKAGWIIPGVSPIQSCTIHRQIHVDPNSGKRLCQGDESRGEPRIAEFLDSDVQASFRLAGIRRDDPPPFEKPCEEIAGGDSGAHPPVIVSPQPGMRYPVRAGGRNPIEFSATHSGGRHRLFWFVDDTYVGEGSSVTWEGRPGQFEVRVVDDQGQFASVDLAPVPVE